MDFAECDGDAESTGAPIATSRFSRGCRCAAVLFRYVSLVSQSGADVFEAGQEKRVMRYRDHEISYDAENGNLEAEFVRQQASGKQYRRKRSIRATRRSVKATASKPGCGIG